MKKSCKRLVPALMTGSAILVAGGPAFAQVVQPGGAPAAGAMSAEDVAAKAALLEAQVRALQEQIDALKKQAGATTPSWKGAPQLEDKASGWSFKPRGRLQYDVAHIDNPEDAIATRNLGFNARARRLRLGAEGTIPGDFGYKFEVDFANADVGFADAFLTYSPKGRPWSVTIGNHETFESLEQVTSSNVISFLERAQMNDAFLHTRRIGVSAGLVDKSNTARFNAGLFAAHSIDASFGNDGWIGAARATYSPQALGGLLHLGANYQHREFSSNNGGAASSSSGAPSNQQLGRYRARPFLQTTDVRFVDTGGFAARSDDIVGVELAGIFGALHLAGEAQVTMVDAYAPGATASGLGAFGSGNSALTASEDPRFFSWYAEAGYFLTGETRGYKNGRWDRTKVLNPFSKGGWGAFQLNARYDHLDLSDRALQQGIANDFTTGAFSPSTNFGRGGKQTGYLASLIWTPEDYVRFLLQYTHTEVEGGPFAAAVRPASTERLDERSFGLNSIALRAQLDF